MSIGLNMASTTQYHTGKCPKSLLLVSGKMQDTAQARVCSKQLTLLTSFSLSLAIASSPDLQHVAVVGLDGGLRVIDIHTERLLDTFQSYFGALNCVCWSPDGKYILTGGQDDLVTIWSFKDQRIVARCQGHQSYVTGVAFDPWRCDERNYRFGSVGEDAKLLLWDFSVGALHKPKAVSFLCLFVSESFVFFLPSSNRFLVPLIVRQFRGVEVMQQCLETGLTNQATKAREVSPVYEVTEDIACFRATSHSPQHSLWRQLLASCQLFLVRFRRNPCQKERKMASRSRHHATTPMIRPMATIMATTTTPAEMEHH